MCADEEVEVGLTSFALKQGHRLEKHFERTPFERESANPKGTAALYPTPTDAVFSSTLIVVPRDTIKAKK